ncbi:MAG TPA: deoxyribodipyrimidine photo-lyase [Candidatus Obscuribacterales bacterium]
MSSDASQHFMAPTIVWLRKDLRIFDNAALTAAAAKGAPVIPLYILSPDEEGKTASSCASSWWLASSLTSLANDLSGIGAPLVVREGETLSVLREIIHDTGAAAVFWNRHYEPLSIVKERNLKGALAAIGMDVQTFAGNLLYEPWQILSSKCEPYRIFGSFCKALMSLPEPDLPLEAVSRLTPVEHQPTSIPIDELNLAVDERVSKTLPEYWQVGESSARKKLSRFIDERLQGYSTDRDFPACVATSRLSPHLVFGEISARTVFHAVRNAGKNGGSSIVGGANEFLRQLCWREFAYNQLYHYPSIADSPLKSEFESFPWQCDEGMLASWKQGNTGYPLIDAAMRELLTTGWINNRMRMIVASFLVKDLLLSWQEGARWFSERLVDADMANNVLGWQWSAGCGFDCAKYTRIFNPVVQSAKFDPSGDYIRAWVPEVKRLDSKWIHKPWEAPNAVLREANIELGATYPLPLVDHKMARQRALHAFEIMRLAQQATSEKKLQEAGDIGER